MVLYVVRHGQTDYNAEMRFQGRLDIPLNEHGKKQARGNGRALRELLGDKLSEFDFVSSPLGRTRQTMELIREELGIDAENYRLDDRLIEICFGDWEGFTISNLEQAFPELYQKRESDKWSFIPPGEQSESYGMVAERIAPYLKSVDKPTVCVCHGGVIRTMFQIINGGDLRAAAAAPIPQDRVLKIENNQIGWL
ncbi:MAG: histidine phosphatase family protein [Rhizobiaceae bacterium]|nr:histidine phosphatase family protein [Rhizobiaceae bacterium]